MTRIENVLIKNIAILLVTQSMVAVATDWYKSKPSSR